MHQSTLLDAGFPLLAPTYNVENLPPTPKYRVKWYLDVAAQHNHRSFKYGQITQVDDAPNELAFAVTIDLETQEFLEYMRNAWGRHAPDFRITGSYKNKLRGICQITVRFFIPR